MKGKIIKIVFGIVIIFVGVVLWANFKQNNPSENKQEQFQPSLPTASVSTTPATPVIKSLTTISSSSNVRTTNQPSATQKQIAQNDTEPHLLLKSIGFNLDYYDVKTGMAGDMRFTQLPLRSNFGWIMADFGVQDPRTSDPTKTNPQPVFILPLGTKVHSLVDGTVINVQQLYSNDYSIMVAESGRSSWIYETEHIINPLVKKGDHVTGGQVIGEVSDHDSDHNPGFGIVEIGILHGGNPPHHVCPFVYLDKSIKDDILKKITALHNDWEAYRGDASLYKDLSTYALPGCATLTPANG